MRQTETEREKERKRERDKVKNEEKNVLKKMETKEKYAAKTCFGARERDKGGKCGSFEEEAVK